MHLHLPLVEHCARRFRNRGEPFEDLVQVGTIGLIKSIDRFDTDRGVEFSTYATPTIIGEIKRYFRDKGWAIRVPRRLQELRMQISGATAELTQRLGRSPTPRELAEEIGCTVEEIIEGLESSNAYSTLSLDATNDDDDGSSSMLDAIGIDDEGLEHVEIRESIKPLLEQLDPREKKILLLRFFKNMTQSQIAEEIGVSQMHVSRLLSRTLSQLRSSLEEDQLGRPGQICLLGGERVDARGVQHAGEDDGGRHRHGHGERPEVAHVPGDAELHELGEQHRPAHPRHPAHQPDRAGQQGQPVAAEEHRAGDRDGTAVGVDVAPARRRRGPPGRHPGPRRGRPPPSAGAGCPGSVTRRQPRRVGRAPERSSPPPL